MPSSPRVQRAARKAIPCAPGTPGRLGTFGVCRVPDVRGTLGGLWPERTLPVYRALPFTSCQSPQRSMPRSMPRTAAWPGSPYPLAARPKPKPVGGRGWSPTCTTPVTKNKISLPKSPLEGRFCRSEPEPNLGPRPNGPPPRKAPSLGPLIIEPSRKFMDTVRF